MRILFDQGTPAPLVPFLAGHDVIKARDMGWDKLANGELLAAAEQAGFEVLVTTDKNMVARQNLTNRGPRRRGPRKFPVAHCAAVRPQDIGSRRCRHARKLHRN